QAFVSDALVKLELAEITVIDTLGRKRLMEPDHQWLVLRPDRANHHCGAILEGPGAAVLDWGRTDSRVWQLRRRSGWRVKNDAGVQRHNTFGGNQERIDINLGDPRLLDHQLAEANQQFFQGGQVDRRPAAHALERLVDAGLFHDSSSEGGIERR